MAFLCVELGNMLLHNVGITCLSQPIHQLRRLGGQCGQPCADMVRDMYALTSCLMMPLSNGLPYTLAIRIMLGASVGLPAASMCINRRLYHIASVQTVAITQAEVIILISIETRVSQKNRAETAFSFH